MESKKERYRRTLDELVESGRFIPGIYNYCDRWCERCTMTRKCLTFAHEQEMQKVHEGNSDEENENFWEQIKLSWEVTMDMISEHAEEMGIDLNNLPDVKRSKHVERPVEKLAKKYSTDILKWLGAQDKLLKEKAAQSLVTGKEADTKIRMMDAWEVVQWYSVFISAKVHRAHFEIDERVNDPEDEYNEFSDNLGSAKIAVIAIDRSMNALSLFYSEMKEEEDNILKFLVQLSSIKKEMLATFPGAMAFKRPGFDDDPEQN